ncbi:hypothetical protein CJ203_10760, partial [Corynebacterium tuscaniense]
MKEGVTARAVSLVKTYGSGDTQVTALDGVSVEFARNQFTAIMGPSGSGKSTLMHAMAGLDSFNGGSAFIGDTDLATLNDKEITALRRDRLGFIFQSFNGPDPRKVDTSGVSYAAWVSVAELSASKVSGARRLHQECRLR